MKQQMKREDGIMRKQRFIVGILGVVFLSGFVLLSAQAAQTETIAVKVTVSPSISISVSSSSISLGLLSAGATKVSTSAITVTNNGTGVNETYSLSLTNPTGWTASQTAAGAEIYALCAAFSNVDTGIVWGMTNHALSTIPVACSTTKFAGDQNGVAVAYNATRKLWFQFKAPTSTVVNTEQNISVVITAQAG